jgi:hypothetical protein
MSDAPQLDMTAVKRLFSAFHAMYGDRSTTRFAIGELNDDGEDMGVASAQRIWLQALRGFPVAVILQACAKCMDKHPTFAPTLPEFAILCKAQMPTVWQQSEHLNRMRLPFTPAKREAEFGKIRDMLKNIKSNLKPDGDDLANA